MNKMILLTAAALMLSLGSAQADSEPAPSTVVRQTGSESVVRDQTTSVSIALNARTVKCSAADYQAPMLKVLVPGLAELTVLNHRNTREGAPCIAAGRCINGHGPRDILGSGEGTDEVPVRVVLMKIAHVDGDACRVSLRETVSANIRGVPFSHERSWDVADRAAADCR